MEMATWIYGREPETCRSTACTENYQVTGISKYI